MLRLILVSLVGLAIVPAQNVEIRPRFVAGDEFTLAITRSVGERFEKTLSDPLVEHEYSINLSAQVRVVSSGPEGTVLQWHPRTATLKGTAVGLDARMAAAVLATTGLDFLLSLDANGQYRRITNVADLTSSLERARATARAQVISAGASASDASGVDALTPPQMASTVGDMAEVFTGLYGLARPVGQELEIPATFPGLGAQGVPGIRRIRILSANDSTVEASMTLALDQAALRKVLPGAAEQAFQGIDLTETARYVFDRSVGLHRSGTFERTATSGSNRRYERLVFTLASAPKR